MRRSAMESALQLEVTAHAAAKARQGITQDSLTAMAFDLEQQRAGVAGCRDTAHAWQHQARLWLC